MNLGMETDEALTRLWEEVAESVAQASPLAMAAERAVDTECSSGDWLRELLLEEVKKHRQKALQKAWDDYKRAVADLQSRKLSLSGEPLERRQLLASLFEHFPQMQNTFVTIQHREFKNLSDSDVESFLRQLDGLGVLEAIGNLKKETKE